MVNNVIRFIVDINGNILEQQGEFRANNNASNKVQFVAPFPIDDGVSVTFTKPSHPDKVTYLMATSYKGADVVEETNSLYQDIAEWNVWEKSLEEVNDQYILAWISKWRNTDIKVSFNVGEITPNTKCLDFKGYFGTDTNLPSTGQTTGDYYACEDPKFTIADNGNGRTLVFGKGMYVYWTGSYWNKVALKVSMNTPSTTVPVDANAGQGYEIDDDEAEAIEITNGNVAINAENIQVNADAIQDIKDGVDLGGIVPDFDFYDEKETLADNDLLVINDNEDNDSVKNLKGVLLETKEPTKYIVGENQQYKTITEAVNSWTTDSKPNAIIFITNGIYNESIHLGTDVNIRFVGEDKYNTIVRYDKGYYAYATFEGFGGEKGLHFENLTIISSHDDVGNYEYISLSSELPTTEKSGAYCIHSDLPTTANGLVTVNNCILINYQTACVGFETNENQKIIIKNTEMYTYAETDENGGLEEARNYGALLFQSANNQQGEGQSFILNNNLIYSKNGYSASFTSYDPNGIDLYINNNNFLSDAYDDPNDFIKTAESIYAPFETCFRFAISNNNNNVSLVNKASYNKFYDNQYSENLYDIFSVNLSYGLSNATASIIVNGIKLTATASSGNVFIGNVTSYNVNQYYVNITPSKKYIISYDSDVPSNQILLGEFKSDNTYIGYKLFDAENKVIKYTPTDETVEKIALRFGWSFNDTENIGITEGNYTNISIYELEEEKEIENNNIIFELRKEIDILKSRFTFSGTTTQRPSNPTTGLTYFDTTLNKPIWFDGTNWVDATGTIV